MFLQRLRMILARMQVAQAHINKREAMLFGNLVWALDLHLFGEERDKEELEATINAADEICRELASSSSKQVTLSPKDAFQLTEEVEALRELINEKGRKVYAASSADLTSLEAKIMEAINRKILTAMNTVPSRAEVERMLENNATVILPARPPTQSISATKPKEKRPASSKKTSTSRGGPDYFMNDNAIEHEASVASDKLSESWDGVHDVMAALDLTGHRIRQCLGDNIEWLQGNVLDDNVDYVDGDTRKIITEALLACCAVVVAGGMSDILDIPHFEKYPYIVCRAATRRTLGAKGYTPFSATKVANMDFNYMATGRAFVRSREKILSFIEAAESLPSLRRGSNSPSTEDDKEDSNDS